LVRETVMGNTLIPWLLAMALLATAAPGLRAAARPAVRRRR
jgi:hypothetical protein